MRTSPGWTYRTEQASATELELSFRRADGEGEAALHAKLEAGAIQVTIEGGVGEPDD